MDDIAQESSKPAKPKDGAIVKFIKFILYVAILSVVAMGIYAFLVRDAIRQEGDTMITYVNRMQDLYFAMSGRFHSTPRTSHDGTLGIDMSNNRFFTAFSTNSTGDARYEVQLYGRTNAFTIALGDLQRWLASRS